VRLECAATAGMLAVRERARLRREKENSMTSREELARQIFSVAHLTGAFRLRSGTISNEYFDKYRFESNPRILRAIAEHMKPRVPRGIDALAGLEMGAIPVVTMLSQETGLPALFVRKKAKEYGTCRAAEGGEISGRRLLVIEDVVTSGGQILESVKLLRHEGAQIASVLCVIDRESGGREHLAANNLALNALFTITELKSLAASAVKPAPDFPRPG
jgi:orotate phosphoribosyltransferase